MFDTMTITKAGAAVCGALLIFLLGNWAAESLYSTEAGGHGDEEHAQGYVIETGAGEEEAEEAVEVAFADVLATADVAKGEKLFAKCKACHSLEDGKNITGPHLFSVVGRAKASVEGFGYSAVLTGLGGDWDAESLNEFLASPKTYAPGTKMSFAGFKTIEERANIVAYLQSIGG